MSTLAVLLKESWSDVEEDADELANHFYARLFLADANLRDLFPVEMTAHRSRFLTALITIIQSVDDPERFDAYVRDLGRQHRRYHVEPAHYALVGHALIESLRTFAGSRWSIEYDQAWRDTYDAIATKMLRGAEQDSAQPAFWHAEVVAHNRRGNDLAIVTCRPLDRFDYQPGQYVCLESQHHPRTWRRYSIGNAPRADGTLDFHVRVASGGWVSAALVRRLKVGDMLRLGPAIGTMTLDHHSTRDLVCVGDDSGLAAIRAIVEELAGARGARRVRLFLGSRDRQDLYDLPYLTQLAGQHSWLSLIPSFDDPAFPGVPGLVNDVMERLGPWPEHDFLICGRPEVVRATMNTLVRMGVPLTRVRYDTVGADPR
jgi:NAD(P)H-flavin reductase/hemoglobin-like flavoprotein